MIGNTRAGIVYGKKNEKKKMIGSSWDGGSDRVCVRTQARGVFANDDGRAYNKCAARPTGSVPRSAFAELDLLPSPPSTSPP